MEQTDEEHSLTTQELIHQLNLCGVECERKSLYDDIEALRGFGLGIETRKGRGYSYYLADREFALPELKLLADAVASSRFITHKKSEELVGKLAALTSKPQANRLRRQVYVANRVKSRNEQVYYNIDGLHEALADHRKISFRYFEYTVDKQKHYRRDGAEYVVSPCALVWDDEKYYLVAYYPKYNSILHFRVDKMERIRVLDEAADNIPADLNFEPAKYAQKVFGMYGGEEETVRLRFANDLIGVVLDRFGQDILVRRDGEEHFVVDVKVAV
ncbi:MAG: WYL domain-containing protein, partial [Oscillospiraceae bacterium]|nr:WYL domain-containing protein [Oscillospiraceae bacterium]